MNQVDVLVLIIIGASAFSGARRGVIGAGGDVAAVLLGLTLSSFAYPVMAAPLEWMGLPHPFCDLFGFLALAICVVFLVGWAAALLSENWQLSARTNRIGGAALGGLMGMVLGSVLLLVSGVVTGTAKPVQESRLGGAITSIVPKLHETMERAGMPLPKLIQLPADYRDEMSGVRHGLQFMRINSARLDGATCLHCRTPVKFLGYKFSRGTLMSPKFQCPNCGRTSDGCQTFEGFHTIYGVCPVTLADQGVQFDCGVWTNGWFTVPHGKCPVCGKGYTGPGVEGVAADQ